jgi:hypothetical protein
MNEWLDLLVGNPGRLVQVSAAAVIIALFIIWWRR